MVLATTTSEKKTTKPAARSLDSDVPAATDHSGSAELLVWDWPLRAFHWLLALSIGGSWLTAELGVEYTPWHMRLGYCAIGLLVFRLLWGLLGSRYARFGAWLPGPLAIVAYLRGLFDRQAPRAVGHNPLGAVAVWVMLGLIAVQAGSGLFTDDDVLYTGPYQGAVSSSLSERLTNLHHSNFDWLLLALGTHIVAILFYLFYKKQNLVTPMLTGRQQRPQPANPTNPIAAQPPAWWRTLLAIALSALFVYALITLAPAPVYEDYF